jgi:predicted ATPase
MLIQLQLQNFKSWKDTKPIRLASLTSFFGTNSSGKSSIEQFFLMLKQTVDSSDRKMVIYPGDANTPVNVGSFDELIFDRNRENTLGFAFEWTLPEPLTIMDPRSNFKCSGNQIRFEAEIGAIGKHTTPVVHRFEYELTQDGQNQMKVWVQRKSVDKSEYELGATPYLLTRYQMRAWPLGSPIKFYGFPESIAAYYQNADFVQDFSLQMEKLLRSISYLGPLRSKPERLYNWTGGEPESVGYSGEQTIAALLAAKERKLSLAKRKKSKPFQEFIAQRLKQLELIDEFEVRQISSNRKEYEVKVRTVGSPLWVDLADVGFGVSQVLPVVVQCFYASPRSILFIEQPELHLHPRAQSNLADFFIDVLSSREGGEERHIQLVIETHSEHLLNRLQRRIAEDDSDHSLSANQVAAYFANPSGSGSKLEALKIDRFGNIANWPDRFFGDSIGDLFEMSKASARRKQEEEKSA